MADCYRIGVPQGQYLGEWNEQNVADVRNMARTTFVQMAVACVRATGRTYVDLVAPCEPDQMRRDMSKMWGCALLIRALFRLLGVVHPRLRAPYKSGAAPADLLAVARAVNWPTHKVKGALLYPSKHPGMDSAVLLNRGHILCIGQGSLTHYLVLIGLTVEGTVLSVDGGQDKGPGIEIVERKLVVQGGELYLKDKNFTRRIRFAIDPGLLLPLIPPDVQWMLPRWGYSSHGVTE
jgi:hypothetical protein